MRVSHLLALMLLAAVSAAPVGGGGEKEPPADQATINANIEKWINMAHAQLTSLGIDAFGTHFTPPYLANRTRAAALERQVYRFRAAVGIAMAESLGEQVIVCPYGHITVRAAQTVVEELRNRTFDAHWIRDRSRCPGHGGYVYVHLPPPKDATVIERV